MIKRLIIINYLNGKITYGVYNFNFYNTFPMGGIHQKPHFPITFNYTTYLHCIYSLLF